MRKLLLSRAALLLGGTAAALLVSEALLRWVLPAHLTYLHPAFVVTDVAPTERENGMAGPMLGSVLHYTAEPWSYRWKRNLRARLVSSEFDASLETNDLGLRGPPLGPSAPVRILGLGDSFAAGFGVEYEETYLSVLERLLAGSGTAAETINAGVIGYNLYNSYHYLAGAGMALHPRVVILQIWVGDDLAGGAAPWRPLERGEAPAGLLLKTAVRRSYLAMFLRDRLRAHDGARHWLMERDLIVGFDAHRILRRDLAERRRRQFDQLASLLGRFQALCDHRGVRLVVLLIPLKEQVSRSHWERALAYNLVTVDADQVDLGAPNRILRRLLAAQGTETVDVLGALRDQADSGPCYFDIDPHLTPVGHRTVGAALFDHLSPSL